jgi:hypothetical protein
LWGVRGKQNDIFLIKLRAKCLPLAMVSSWRKRFSIKELVGVRCNLKKFKKHLTMFQHSLIPYKRYKMLYRQMSCMSIRARRATERFTLLTTEQRDILLLDNDDPMTYTEALMGPNSEKWLGAMESEVEFIHDNQVWKLVDTIDGVRPISHNWSFEKKMDKDRNVHIYKARLVVKGFKQIHGIDYDETFSSVTMLKSVWILLAIAAYFDYEIWQMDVKVTFLNGNLTEDVYMTQPEGFVDPKNVGKICKLQKSIYGLKQASGSWNMHFDEVVKVFGFIRNVEEPCVYKKVSGSAVVFLILYVDDILLIGHDIPMMEAIKSSLRKIFSMKELGEAAYILGIKI